MNINKINNPSISDEEKDIIINTMLHQYFKDEADRAYLNEIVVKSETALNQLPVSNLPIVVPLWQRTWVRAAAACLVLFSGAYYLLPKASEDARTAQQLATDYLTQEPPIGLVVTQMDVKEDITSRIEGRTHFQDKHYENSITSLSQIKDQMPNDVLLLAMAYLYQTQPNYEQSIALLQKVRAKKADYYVQEIHWYLALSYIKLDKIELAKGELHQMYGWHEAEKKALLNFF